MRQEVKSIGLRVNSFFNKRKKGVMSCTKSGKELDILRVELRQFVVK